MDDKTTSAVLKEQFAMIAILVVLIGTVYTDSYYAALGLRYQFLNLPASHIAYRGLTALVDAPYLVLPYFVGILWLGFASTTGKANAARLRIWAGYLVIAVVVGIAYPLASYAGQRAAKRDLGNDSHLPKVKLLLPKEAANGTSCGVADTCRLLLVDSEYLYMFVPQGPNDVPHVKRLDRKVFNEIDTGAD